ncbi:GPI-anchored wall transfer protein 1 [Thraustotheca clavata]|uniref:GPI-anchored wall transfer protein 1 n=1 Tax=Thraustotheca clavata TaxID=74557 RepID=A0A1V9Y6U6_9STRA|nr:GPI-anchored wall transfer protein 1 [Thraustotheca clavata]
MEAIDSDEYKRAKEAFVSGNNGTTMGEVALVLSVLSTSMWFYNEVMFLVERSGVLTGSKLKRTAILFVIEYTILVLPILVAFTFTEYALPITVFFGVFGVILGGLSWKHANESTQKQARNEKVTLLMAKENAAVTCFRAQMMICTVVAILAVDFTIFPRRFSKTETYGVSLMDSGVGLFIMSSALTSSYARGAPDKRASSRVSLRAIWGLFRPMIPVLILGVVRFITVKKVNYQEHVTEYGVHWNFYITLASLYFSYSLLSLFGSIFVSVPTALIILTCYQIALTNYGVTDYIFNAPRVDLFSQNREGIFSLCGYLPLYIFSVAIGKVIFSQSKVGAKMLRSTRWVAAELFMICFLCFLVTNALTLHVTPASRRLLNTPYVGWCLAQGLIVLVTHSIANILSIWPRVPIIFSGMSRNQLFVFLIANLSTGIVNLNMRTIYASPVVGATVMFIYMFALSLLAVVLEYFNIKIKL